MQFSYNQRVFKSVSNSSKGEVNHQTLFRYFQEGNLVWGEYSGGEIQTGFLIGIVLRMEILNLFTDCEMDLKETLHIARIAAENEDFSWELNYDFPYDDERFIHRYQQLISDLENRELANLDAIRLELKTQLSEQDFEYMIWQEWKERFARFLENRIRQVTGLDPNHSGRNLPFDRIIFYHGGSLFIEHLIDSDPELAFEQRALFQRIRMGQK